MNFQYNQDLPIFRHRDEIITAIRDHQVIVVSGETGSGKTTQLPLICLEAGRGTSGVIACTQPRRVAAISLAHHVAGLCGTETGHEVGYRIRFHDAVSPQSRIHFVTDGILLAETGSSRELDRYDTIIIDEAHERSLNIDFLLGYLRILTAKRPDLKIIISSATLDTGLFSRYFGHAPVFTVSGRTFPMHYEYRSLLEMWDGGKIRSYIEAVIEIVRETMTQRESGDILVFLPTVRDVSDTVNGLRHTVAGPNTLILPLHGRLPRQEQQQIFQPYDGRKIVVATNIAETSVTVPGIRYVVDTGLVRTTRYDPEAGLTRMPVEPISRASADQRAGRCGRVRDGVCIRLFSERDYESRPQFSTPEIQRSNLAGVVLRMHHLRIGRTENFPFLQKPSHRALTDGYRRLRELGAVNRKGRLTSLGHRMGAYPLDPPISRMLLTARSHKVIEEIAIIASALSVGELWAESSGSHGSHKHVHRDSDFITFVNIWDALHKERAHTSGKRLSRFCETHGLALHRVREWFDIHGQIARIARIRNRSPRPMDKRLYAAVHKCLLVGLIGRVAVRQDNALYRGEREHDIAIFPGSVLFRKSPEWVLFKDFIETTRIFGRTAAAVKPEWIEEVFPRDCRYDYEDIAYDPELGEVRASEQVTFRGLPLVRHRSVTLSQKRPEQAHEVFIDEALVEEKLEESFSFMRENRGIRDKISAAEIRLRTRDLYAGDRALHDFYSENLGGVCTLEQLQAAVRARGDDSFLCIPEHRLLTKAFPPVFEEYPDDVYVATTPIRLSYVFAPGREDDGVTMTVPESLFTVIPASYWEWFLPAYRAPRVREILQWVGHLLPVGDENAIEKDIGSVCSQLVPGRNRFLTQVAAIVKELFGVIIPSDAITAAMGRLEYWPRINVVNSNGIIVESARTPLKQLPSNGRNGLRPPEIARFCVPWEQSAAVNWNQELLDPVPIEASDQLIPVYGTRAFHVEDGVPNVRVFFLYASATRSHAEGVRTLLELRLADPLAWELQPGGLPEPVVREWNSLLDKEELEHTVTAFTEKKMLDIGPKLPRTPEQFDTILREKLESATGSREKTIRTFKTVIREYGRIRTRLDKARQKRRLESQLTALAEIERHLDALLKKLLSEETPIPIQEVIPRCLAGLESMIDLALGSSPTYRARTGLIQDYRKRLAMRNSTRNRKSYEHAYALDETAAELELFASVVETREDAVRREYLDRELARDVL